MKLNWNFQGIKRDLRKNLFQGGGGGGGGGGEGEGEEYGYCLEPHNIFSWLLYSGFTFFLVKE